MPYFAGFLPPASPKFFVFGVVPPTLPRRHDDLLERLWRVPLPRVLLCMSLLSDPTLCPYAVK